MVFGTACQIVSQCVRFCRERRREKQIEGYLVPQLGTLLQRLREGGKSVLNVMGALAVLQELVAVEGGVFFGRIGEEVEEKGALRAVAELLAVPQSNKLEEMRKIEGSNYGIHPVGMYDPAFLFLHRLLVRAQKESPKRMEELLRGVRESKVQGRLAGVVVGLSSKVDLSPRGLISLLMVVYDVVSEGIGDEFAEEGLLGALVGLLGEEQVEALGEWPVGLGGGEVLVG